MTGVLEAVRRHTRDLSIDSLLSRLSPTKAFASYSPTRGSPTKGIPPLLPTASQVPDEKLPIKIRMGELECTYEDGDWKVEGSEMQSAQIEQLIERNRELEGENQLLKFKVNYLMDMLATTKLDALQLQSKGQKKKL